MTASTRREILKRLGLGVAALKGLETVAFAQVADQPAGGSAADLKADEDSLLAYFAHVTPELLRPAEGALVYASIAPTLPGKQYSTSLWDWDTLWTAKGLFQVARATKNEAFRKQICTHVQGNLKNFLRYQSKEGRIPIMIGVKEPDLFGSADGKYAVANQAKPVFGQLALLVADECGSVEWLAEDFDRLLRFYDSWGAKNLSRVGLYVWSNDVAIGDDNDPTTFGRPDYSSANLLLNCLFYRDLAAAAELARRLKREADHARLAAQTRALGEKIQTLCWDPRDRFYYTVDVQCVDRRAELIPSVARGMDMQWQALPLRIQMFTGFLPMWCGLATKAQAEDLVRLHYANRESFHGAYGVRSLSARETMYSLAFSSNPSNWLGPVWIVVNYLVWKGLVNYGYAAEARELACTTVRMLAADLKRRGSLNEYYHPETGASLSHAGFLDWNLLVAEMMG
ncbi:MAG: trehalase family glycosidase [Terracidiphilus sp.]|nr:trehalase family glycosidase [Terracidiphilus sp.]